MAIRIREVEGVLVALCAYETDSEPNDFYIHDGQQYALLAKFMQDYQDREAIEFPKEWALMETQKLRDAKLRSDLR